MNYYQSPLALDFFKRHMKDLPSNKMYEYRHSVDNYNTKINLTTASLASNHLRKQTRKQLENKLSYYTKQRNSILNLYPEYFI